MAFTPKAWVDGPTSTTLLNSAALIDLEKRVTDYADLITGIVSVKKYGAKGDNSTDDTVAIDAAFVAGNGAVFFPAGFYIYNGSGYSGNNPVVIGAGIAKTKITLGANKSLITSASVVDSLLVQDIDFAGGYGAIRLTWTGSNVSNEFHVARCYFVAYTGAAISTLASDMPLWNITYCRFLGANYTSTMGIVMMGNTDNTVITDNEFETNRIHIKLALPNNVRIQRNGFIRFNGGTPPNPRIDLWFVPKSVSINSGVGAVISDNKFGPELILAGDYRVVYADEDQSAGTDPSNYWPNLTTASTGFISGHRYSGNAVGMSSVTGGVPFVFSTTPNVQGCEYSGIILASNPTMYLQFLVAPAPYRENAHNLYGPWQGANGAGIDLPPFPVSNDPAGYLDDPLQIMVYDRPHQYQGGSDLAGYKNLLTTKISAFTLGSGATTSAVTDSINGTDASEIVFANASSLASTILNTTPTVGIPVWVEFDAKLGVTSPGTQFYFNMTYTSPATIHFQRVIVPLAGWRRYRYLWTPREATTTIRFVFGLLAGSPTGSFDIGRLRVYHAYEPVINGGIATSNGGVFTSTPGAVTTVNIPHNIVGTPTKFSIQPGDTNSRSAPTYYITATSTNLVLNFTSALVAATAYTWNWRAEI